MRQFTRSPIGKALDLDFNIECHRTGPPDPDDATRMITYGYELETLQPKSRRYFTVLEPFFPDLKIIDGVRMVEDIIGHWSVTKVLEHKTFCPFTGPDFEFLQYLGSGIINCRTLLESFRVRVLAPEEKLKQANVAIPDNAERTETGMIVLADSKDMFVRK